MEIKGIPGIDAVKSGASGQGSAATVATPFVPGQEYQAEVVSYAQGQVVLLRLQDGLVNVKLAGDVSAGQVVTLKFLSGDPIPTFEVIGANAGNSSAYVAISNAATLIGQFLAQTSGVPDIGETVTTGPPLLSQVTDAASVAAELKQSLSGSGLFYESQLANLVLGGGGAEHLMAQPQNAHGFDPAGLVSKQLEIFESNAVRWAGTVWAGQVMHWTTQIEEESPADPNAGDHAAQTEIDHSKTVTSTMTLDLPKLKKIAATFKLRSNGSLSLSLKAADDVAASLLRPALPRLVDALTASGQNVTSCLVSPHDKA